MHAVQNLCQQNASKLAILSWNPWRLSQPLTVGLFRRCQERVINMKPVWRITIEKCLCTMPMIKVKVPSCSTSLRITVNIAYHLITLPSPFHKAAIVFISAVFIFAEQFWVCVKIRVCYGFRHGSLLMQTVRSSCARVTHSGPRCIKVSGLHNLYNCLFPSRGGA